MASSTRGAIEASDAGASSACAASALPFFHPGGWPLPPCAANNINTARMTTCGNPFRIIVSTPFFQVIAARAIMPIWGTKVFVAPKEEVKPLFASEAQSVWYILAHFLSQHVFRRRDDSRLSRMRRVSDRRNTWHASGADAARPGLSAVGCAQRRSVIWENTL